MARGTPDGGYSGYSGLAANQSDLGSVSDRLLMGGGSISKTGRIIWATGFEGITTNTDFSFGSSPVAAAGGVTQGNGNAWQGQNFLNLQTAGGLGNTAYMYKYFPASLQSGRWGVEFMLNIINASNNHIDVYMEKRGGGHTYRAIIRLVADNTGVNFTIQYLNSSGVYTNIDTFSGVFAYGLWSNFKFVVDFSNNQYVSFSMNNKVYPINQNIYDAGLNNQDYAYFSVNLTADAAIQVNASLDNVILTSDEP